MENKNNIALYSLIFAIVGLIIGWLIWGNTGMVRMPRTGMHQIPDGLMMNNDGMNMDSMMGGMMAELEGKTGDAFDRAFITEMIVHHEGAVAMAEAAKTNANHQEIKTMANAIISAQTNEIEQMKKWLKDWYATE